MKMNGISEAHENIVLFTQIWLVQVQHRSSFAASIHNSQRFIIFDIYLK